MQQEKEIFNREEFLERLSGDEELVKEIISVFVEDVSTLTEDLRTAFENDDMKSIGQIAHRIKGSAANVSAEALRKISAEIEAAARDNDMETARPFFPQLVQQLEKLKALLAGK